MRKQRGMTLEGHKQFGKAITAFEEEILKVLKNYQVTSKVSRTAWRTANLLMRLKSDMENQMFVDIPDVGETDFISVYYCRGQARSGTARS